jgi:hypothetical protein
MLLQQSFGRSVRNGRQIVRANFHRDVQIAELDGQFSHLQRGERARHEHFSGDKINGDEGRRGLEEDIAMPWILADRQEQFDVRAGAGLFAQGAAGAVEPGEVEPIHFSLLADGWIALQVAENSFAKHDAGLYNLRCASSIGEELQPLRHPFAGAGADFDHREAWADALDVGERGLSIERCGLG